MADDLKQARASVRALNRYDQQSLENEMITGNTRLFGIVADPIAQVRTPQVLNAYFESEGLDAVLVPMHVGAAGLATVFEAFRQIRNLGGFIVTVPHKTDAV